MNGVRRFLGGGSSTPSSQAVPLPSTPPSVPATLDESPKTTAALVFRKDRQRTAPSRHSDDDGNSSFQSSRNSNESGRTSTQPSSPVAGPSSPRMPPLPMRVAELSRGGSERRTSAVLSSKDDLLLSLLASEAIVDSRGFEILSAEEVEELKKVRTQHTRDCWECVVTAVSSRHPLACL